MFNSEWFRTWPSKLELTLRFPYLFWFSFILFISRPLILWLVFGFLLYLMLQNPLFSIIIGFVLALFFELFNLRNYYLNKALPFHLKNLKKVKKLYQNSEKISDDKLITSIIQSVKYSSWSLVNLVYCALPSWGWEIIFKFLYPLFVSTNIPYQNLLIGFGNQVVEADQLLWQTSQTKNKVKQQKLLTKFLEEYGSRSDDLDLSFPTLKEQSKAISKLLNLYRQLPSPQQKIKEQEKRRIKTTKSVIEKVRISKKLFKTLLSQVQKNVVLREDRRLYEFQFDFYIRQLVFKLAKRLNISQDKIFKTSWCKIKNEVSKGHSW